MTLNSDPKAHQITQDFQLFLLDFFDYAVQNEFAEKPVFNFLELHQEKLNANLLKVIPSTLDVLLLNSGSQTKILAQLIETCANLIAQFPLGKQAFNIELALNLHKDLMRFVSRDAMPADWARLSMCLANEYSDRLEGNRPENIEIAITFYNQSLEVFTAEEMHFERALVMMNLANAYSKRVQGSRHENIQEAINLYQNSLRINTREAMPLEWALTIEKMADAYRDMMGQDRSKEIEIAISLYEQLLEPDLWDSKMSGKARIVSKLGHSFLERIEGEKAKNIEDGIEFLEQSLQAITCSDDPVECARTKSSLAYAYLKRFSGDRTENIEAAIAICKEALQIFNREDHSRLWMGLMFNLANAYAKRLKGDKNQNILDAIAAYEQLLQVITFESWPLEWGAVMMNLANTLTLLAAYTHENRAQNIEKAILCYENSMQIRTRDRMPYEWSQSKMSLGNAYLVRITGDKEQNINAAINVFEEVLQVRTQEGMPFEWATLMHNLANAYCQRIKLKSQKGELHLQREDTRSAINKYLAALEIFTSETYPYDCRRSARQLAILYADNNLWQEAQATYQTALNAAEILYQSALSKVSQEVELTESDNLYRCAAYAYAKIGDLKTAVSVLEQGRARSLSETLQRDRVDLETVRQLNPDLVERYQTVANAIRNLESTERRTGLDSNQPQHSETEFRQPATQARQALQACLTEIRQIPGYETFLALPTFADIAASLQPGQPITYLLHTPNGSLALVLHLPSPSGRGDVLSPSKGAGREGITPIWLNDLTDDNLLGLLVNTWFNAYGQAQTSRQGWFDAIDRVTHQLWDQVMAPLVDHLHQQHHYQHATLIPTGYLSFLPLHAAWTEDSSLPTCRRYACDKIQFTYAPNALSLKAARTVAEQTPAAKLLAINEPLPVSASHLPSSSFETAKAVSTFPGQGNFKIWQHEAATAAAVLDALPDYSIVHFSCHGAANFRTPLDSGLLMAHNETLTLRDLLDRKFQGLRLAILSACETGIPGTDLPDEVVSLPTGLLQAGAAGVVSSLWSVADLSTMVLLSRFYDLWRPQEPATTSLDPPAALHQAQLWLRDSTGPQLAPYLQNSHPELATKLEQTHDKRPFAHPFYWAAFTYVGV